MEAARADLPPWLHECSKLRDWAQENIKEILAFDRLPQAITST